jgi:hypothetical protein
LSSKDSALSRSNRNDKSWQAGALNSHGSAPACLHKGVVAMPSYLLEALMFVAFCFLAVAIAVRTALLEMVFAIVAALIFAALFIDVLATNL